MLSIVVVTHNAIDLVRRCMEALSRACSSTDYEVLLVDNGSTDNVRALIGEFSSHVPVLRYIRNEENLTYAIANNRAAADATGSRLLFVNNDVFAGPRSIDRLLEPMRDNSVGITGGLLVYPGTSSIQHAGIHQMLWGYVSNYGVGADIGDSRFLKLQEIFAVTGAMLCVKRDLFESVGGFSPVFRYGYEDVDLCLKSRAAGRRVLYVPEACGFHCESATLGQYRLSRMFDENYRLYRARWDSVLVPAEEQYATSLRQMSLRRVVIFGTGRAGTGLFEALNRAGIETVAFTATGAVARRSTCQGLPVIPLDEVCGFKYDRIIAGSQFFYQVEGLLSRSDPSGNALLPVIPPPAVSPDTFMADASPGEGLTKRI